MTELLKSLKFADCTDHALLNILMTELEAREPKVIHAAIEIPSGLYYVCPQCQITLEREYQAFCENCGQKLDWSHLHEVTVFKNHK